MTNYDMIEEIFKSSMDYIEDSLSKCAVSLDEAIEKSIAIYEGGGTIFFAGNGGSAADANHIASELVGAFEEITTPLPAVSFTTDVATLTSVANDFSFDRIFLQQVQAIVRPGDQLWAISTSGQSMNLFHATAWTREQGISTVGLLGKDGGKIAGQVDIPIVVPGENTQRIQEVHILILHTLASALKRRFPNGIPRQYRTTAGT